MKGKGNPPNKTEKIKTLKTKSFSLVLLVLLLASMKKMIHLFILPPKNLPLLQFASMHCQETYKRTMRAVEKVVSCLFIV